MLELDPGLFAPLRPLGKLILLHPQRLRRLQTLLRQVGKLDDHAFAVVAREIVQVAHVDAVGRAGVPMVLVRSRFGLSQVSGVRW